ncbi:unnamed protein product [Symbiodinium natans]|uniref:Uncharacterized protein n=1 Tax=Symbiodinium natans TaxID=878477 RepID=A0A812TLV7_9DINO|nr:unnamed protein product [Symbiodinium natans]
MYQNKETPPGVRALRHWGSELFVVLLSQARVGRHRTSSDVHRMNRISSDIVNSLQIDSRVFEHKALEPEARKRHLAVTKSALGRVRGSLELLALDGFFEFH